jgi:amidohydrolase
VLRGGKPGPVIAIRADMDALPVTEEDDVPFKSLVKTEYRGQQVGVMHACGHDGHVAVLMGVAQVLAAMRAQLPGTVVFVFQPAEEGAPDGEEGGSKLMLKENALDPRPRRCLAASLGDDRRRGIGYRSGPTMAGSDNFRLVVTGRSTHGGQPWRGVDPIVTAAQIITSMHTVVSRQTDITQTPVVVSVGAIKGGIRNNIIPDSVELLGTIRTYDATVREKTIERVRNVAEHSRWPMGATGRVRDPAGQQRTAGEHPALTARMLPSLQRAAAPGTSARFHTSRLQEDFGAFAQAVPSLYFFVGTTPAARIWPRSSSTTRRGSTWTSRRSTRCPGHAGARARLPRQARRRPSADPLVPRPGPHDP